MLKQLVIILHFFVAAFIVLPKSYFHDCHYEHESVVEKQKSNFSEACHICDIFFFQVFDQIDFDYSFHVFRSFEKHTFFEAVLTAGEIFKDIKSRGPPFTA
ncbi:MAG: hypothetical protein J0G96_03805 [Flavobacteriia bacterium]|nr:hypothetical protein [Flavobacteriia bacterium]OJX39238.1 MAG: hypothetical protein BGO87_04435 [Flavobacteriia bacterium 40-80]